MEKIIALYNPNSQSGNGLAEAKQLDGLLEGKELEYVDSTKIKDWDEYMGGLAGETVILCGGDGTLNYYINHTAEETRKRKLGYFATGTGNDFLADIGAKKGEILWDISKYLVDLPKVKVNGKEYLFLNGVGYGIDGYCCEIGDKLRAKSDKPVNYAGIAIKGILFYFKSRGADIVLDGKEYHFDHAWTVPAMHGRYYGGGMMATPEQDRNAKDKKLSFMVYHCRSRLQALIVFPGIFKGEHVKTKKVVSILSGKTATVRFDEPCALQIDGETILDVSEYTVSV